MAADAFESTGDGFTENLARRASDGDVGAFGRLYERVAPAVYGYAAVRLGWRWVDPEDVVAEVWVRATAELERYDEARPFRGWIFGFARNVIREAQRAAIRSAARGGSATSAAWSSAWPDQATNVSRRVARDEELRRFFAWARESLSDYEQDVLVLRGLQGRDLDEVADGLGRSVRAVTVCWSRLLEKVRSREGGLPAEVLITGP